VSDALVTDAAPADGRAPSVTESRRWNPPMSAAARRRLHRRSKGAAHVLELLRAIRDGALPAESPDSLP
jgi:hypothetical protein